MSSPCPKKMGTVGDNYQAGQIENFIPFLDSAKANNILSMKELYFLLCIELAPKFAWVVMTSQFDKEKSVLTGLK